MDLAATGAMFGDGFVLPDPSNSTFNNPVNRRPIKFVVRFRLHARIHTITENRYLEPQLG